MSAPDSLRNWIRQEILEVLNRKTSSPPLLIWCDPGRVWKDLLLSAAEDGSFELWAEDTHELLLRERFLKASKSPRVVWLPITRDGITYFRVFELQAEEVRQITLPEALSLYGVDIPSDQLADLQPLFPAHAREWLDYPRKHWKDHLSTGQVKSTLVDDELFLEILASHDKPLSGLISEDRLSILNRRAIEDYGLPQLTGARSKKMAYEDIDIENWRKQAVASLLVTEATARCPGNPPPDKDRVIASSAQRENALKLLSRWKKQVDLIDRFETLATKADSLTSIAIWAKNLPTIPEPLSSPAAENALFQKEMEELASTDRFNDLAGCLDERITAYQAHANAFWGTRAKAQIRWASLQELASIASLLFQQSHVEQGWQNPSDSVTWFTRTGWQVDHAGEVLFREDYPLPGGLMGVRSKLRKAYLRHMDRTNSVFSELISQSGLDGLEFPFAGEAIDELAGQATARAPVAVIVLDACRFDLGCRLAELLNQGEPARRAEVSTARAPIPSITDIGMPYCLPGRSENLHVELSEKDNAWRVTIEGFSGDLTVAENRRKRLREKYKLKATALLSISDIVDSVKPEELKVKVLGKLVFVFGDELDDHDGKLKPFGFDNVLKRYARTIRRLRSAGYLKIAVVTDHGFFRWEPEKDEVGLKPDGDILWISRRAVVGRDLKHPTAISLKVPSSDLECQIPRSVNSFRTYGGLGFFHGGATLQEIIIPVLLAQWPKKAQKVGGVLKPIAEINTLNQRIEFESAAVQQELDGTVETTMLGRPVTAKVVDPSTGKMLFKTKKSVSLVPGGSTQAIELEKIESAEAPIGTVLQIQLLDADDEEILDRSEVTLKIDLDEWF